MKHVVGARALEKPAIAFSNLNRFTRARITALLEGIRQGAKRVPSLIPLKPGSDIFLAGFPAAVIRYNGMVNFNLLYTSSKNQQFMAPLKLASKGLVFDIYIGQNYWSRGKSFNQECEISSYDMS